MVMVPSFNLSSAYWEWLVCEMHADSNDRLQVLARMAVMGKTLLLTVT
jgi:hypothetical protein